MYLRAFGQATGTYPVFNITIDEYERGRARAEAEAIRLNMTRAEWEPLLPVPPMNYIHDPATGLWYRAGDITTYAWEISPPVVGGTPGTWQQGAILTDAEAAAWIAKVEATRQPGYGSPLTLPERLDWTAGLTPEEIARIEEFHDFPTAAPPPYVPPSTFEAIPEGIVQQRPAWMREDEFYNWIDIFGGRADLAAALAVSFPTRAEAEAWTPTHTMSDYLARASQFMKYPGIIGAAPPPGAPPLPGAPYTPPASYAPHSGTPMLRQSGWQPDEIGFWLTQAFGGDLALTEAFLLSFRGREELAAWVQPGGPHGAEDVMARAHAALAARRAAPGAPGAPPPAGAEAGGFFSLPMLALLAAGGIFLMRR